jgi:hypothetical protein
VTPDPFWAQSDLVFPSRLGGAHFGIYFAKD